ncbi:MULTISPECIES: DUF190 domain-containing protein [unclassified Proteiniphilum]|jgi:hypothetical protein|uniref:DUF190 domain-containing protein n=1 Tax=Proteiniphilum sp. UBA5259 TaxID=1947269 RepID=UPI00257A12AE|nr:MULTISPECIES: DUF190 domain-containing protein [unclassified Proteiniphilum]
MNNNCTALILRIFISSTDRYKDRLLYEHIVFKAKEYGLSGATVLKGIFGFGASSIIHSYKFWEVTEKLPIVIEIIDNKENILSFYASIKFDLETMTYGCLVTIDETKVLLYKSGQKHP